MGQGHSSEEALVKKIKHALKERGLKVKKKQLVEFFKIVFDICPWFPKDGDVTVRQWKKVGGSLEVFHRQWGPDRIPLTLFSIYNLLYDLIGRRDEDVEVASLMTEGEHLLKELSRPSSPAAPTSRRHPYCHPLLQLKRRSLKLPIGVLNLLAQTPR